MHHEQQIIRTKKAILSDLLKQLKGEDIRRFLPGVNNNIYWLVGHIAASRGSMLRVLGEQVEAEPDLSCFGKGSKAKELSDGPAFSELVDLYHQRGEKLSSVLQKIDPAALTVPARYMIADKEATQGDNLRFLLFHEEYHIGQIALLVRMMGKTGIGV